MALEPMVQVPNLELVPNHQLNRINAKCKWRFSAPAVPRRVVRIVKMCWKLPELALFLVLVTAFHPLEIGNHLDLTR